MRKYFAATAFLVLFLLPRVQNAQSQLFDFKKSRQELEIMKGILQTTLNFALGELQSRDAVAKEQDQLFKHAYGFPGEAGKFSNVGAFYLYGQGAVFTIPTAALRHNSAFPGEAFGTAVLVHESVKSLAEASPLPPTEPQALVPSAPQVSPSPGGKSKQKSPAMNQGDLHKRLAEAQENVKKRKEQETLQRAKVEQLLGEIKAFLIEALANHGDSLSQVKPNEYITLVFTDDTSGYFGLKLYQMESGDGSHQHEIVSVQKSVIMDYKAGKFSLESFKQKVLNYKN